MPKPSKLKPIPKFKTESEERKFWESADSADYVDWSKARLGFFPNLKPSTETISLRLPASLLAELKALANQRDVPYQSLLKIYLAERISIERGHGERRAPVRRLRRSADRVAVTSKAGKRSPR
ncbi:MAG: BrnA antitoxin family protein [Candidatus Eisenbacteria bacterium]|nr:BrnA antitoxin family protein [Candidatus Eisenbacteria bacterium]